MPGNIDTLRKSIQLIINFVKVLADNNLASWTKVTHTLALTLARTGFISFRLLLIIICPVSYQCHSGGEQWRVVTDWQCNVWWH